MAITAESPWAADDYVLAPQPSRARRLWRIAGRKKLGTFGFCLVVAILLIAVFGPMVSPYGADETFRAANPNYDPRSTAADALSPTRAALLDGPSWSHPLGTDNIGRDLLTQVVHGARVSLMVGILAAVIAAGAGTLIGVASGYLGGWFDLVLQRLVDAMIVIPGIILLLLLVQIRQGNLALTIAALGFGGIWSTARVMRSAAIVVSAEAYIDAAQVTGASTGRILFRHVLPNVVGPLIVAFSILIGTNILAEAGLAFLDLSVDAPSWGKMVNNGRTFLESKPMMSIVGGLAITITVLGFNLFGDALRDILDPRQRGAN